MHTPGDVYFLPPRAGEAVDPTKGHRPHLALSTWEPEPVVLTLAYGSTKSTEAAAGAAFVLIDPLRAASRHTGISAPTYFYPSRLVSVLPEDLPRPRGRVVRELPAVRDALQMALGLGCGVTAESNVRGSNRRGRLVRFTEKLTGLTGFGHAIVVTEPAYSRRGRQQTLVPVFPEADFEMVDLDFVAPASGWTRHLRGRRESVIVSPSMIFTVFEPDWIERYAGIVDPITMNRLDEALRLHFGL